MCDNSQALELLRKQRIVTPDHPNFLPLMLGYRVRIVRTGEIAVIKSYRGRYIDGKVDPASVRFEVRVGDVVLWLTMAEIEFPGWVPERPPPR